MNLILAPFLFLALLGPLYSTAQEPTASPTPVSIKYLESISSLSSRVDQKLDKLSAKLIQRLQKREARIRRKIEKRDSLKAAAVFINADEQYSHLKDRLQNGTHYNPSLDTLASSLKFLQTNPQLLSQTGKTNQKLADAMEKIKGMQTRFQNAEEIKKFLEERKQFLREQLNNLGLAKELKKMNKQVYYYNAQLQQYKELLNDHTKAEKKALELLSKTKLFRDFMRRNSQLASLFRLPGDPNDPVPAASLAGLQTRAQVNNLIQQQLAAGGPDAQRQFSQNIQQAQSQLNELKNKIGKPGGSSDDIMPERFKPNNQKIKSFWKRLEWGTNMQSQKANGYFPVTSDIGLSVGYKINDKSIVGIGGSYKVGWGRDIRHINITHQGIGWRSFADWKIKGSFWITGGYEMNYKPSIGRLLSTSPVRAGRDVSAWQQSGLLGLSKKISLNTRFFKNTKLQLLWDFLSYRQVPRTQPVIFRIGYSINNK